MKYHVSNTIKAASFILSFGLLLFLPSCKKDSTEVIEKLFKDSDNYTVYRTNNSTYCNYCLNIATEDLTSALKDSIVTETVKVSGYSKSLYGIFFNGSFNENSVMDNFCSVFINTEGSYMILKYVDGSYYFLDGNGNWVTTPWTFSSSSLLQGLGKSNKIKISVKGNYTYDLYFNNSLVKTFTETQLTNGLKKGLIFEVGKESDEGFPDNFLEIKFKELYAA